MNNSGSHELKALDAMNSFRLWMTSMTLGCKLMPLDGTKSSRLWMISMTRGPMSSRL